jgi:hypothetical protein
VARRGPEKVGMWRGGDKYWTFRMTTTLHTRKKGRHRGVLPYQSRSALNEKARPSLDFAHKLVTTYLACLVAHKVSTETFQPIQLAQNGP